jgi:hypothetical protein
MMHKHIEDYVYPELQKLTTRAEQWEKKANRWYLFVSAMLGAGMVFALCLGFVTLIRSVASITPTILLINTATWLDVVRNTASALIVVGLLSAMVRFAFVMGKSCMVESIRNNNRRHAISLGVFYLKAFGDKMTWSEAKDAFASWNIDIGSAFPTQSPGDVDPEVFLQSAATVLLAMGKKVGEKE